MLERCKKLRDVLPRVELDGSDELPLTNGENRHNYKFCNKLEYLDSVTESLQNESTTMSEARALLDDTFETNQKLALRLQKDACIVLQMEFESGVVNV